MFVNQGAHYQLRQMASSTRHERAYARLLIVDDDEVIRLALKTYLEPEGFEVELAEDPQAMDRILHERSFDLIVLDWMMPGEDGLSVCRRLRSARDNTPVIMLTAKGDEIDRIVGLEVGADDYLTKPFSARELLARIHAVLRRRPAPSSIPAVVPPVQFGDFEFDLNQRRLSKHGEPVELSTAEFSMLKTLISHANEPLSRERLSQLTRGRDFDPSERSLDVQISRLRKLIETDPSKPRLIQTVWGVGYIFVPDGKV